MLCQLSKCSLHFYDSFLFWMMQWFCGVRSNQVQAHTDLWFPCFQDFCSVGVWFIIRNKDNTGLCFTKKICCSLKNLLHRRLGGVSCLLHFFLYKKCIQQKRIWSKEKDFRFFWVVLSAIFFIGSYQLWLYHEIHLTVLVLIMYVNCLCFQQSSN